jgi:hypothetical protein
LCSLRAPDISSISKEKPFFFKFAIIVAAAFPIKEQIERYSEPVDQIRVQLESMKGTGFPRTMHVMGINDSIVHLSWSRTFSEIFAANDIYEHDGKHFVPVDSKAREQFDHFLGNFVQ